MPQNQQEVLLGIFRCALTRPGRKRRKQDFVACGTQRGANKGCALLRTSAGPTSASPTPASHLQHYIARLFNLEHTHPKEEPPPGLDFHSWRQKQSIPSKHVWGLVPYSKHPSTEPWHPPAGNIPVILQLILQLSEQTRAGMQPLPKPSPH